MSTSESWAPTLWAELVGLEISYRLSLRQQLLPQEEDRRVARAVGKETEVPLSNTTREQAGRQAA